MACVMLLTRSMSKQVVSTVDGLLRESSCSVFQQVLSLTYEYRRDTLKVEMETAAAFVHVDFHKITRNAAVLFGLVSPRQVRSA